MAARIVRSPWFVALLASLLTATLMGPVQGAFAANGQADAGLNAVSAGDFYEVLKTYTCPDGGGTCAAVPISRRTVKCNPGDMTLGFSVWQRDLGTGNENIVAAGMKAINGDRYQYLSPAVSEDTRLYLKIFCANVS